MDFSLTTLYTLPVSNTLPTTGTTAALVANQFGVFKPDYTPATAGNVAAQPYIILAQGRPQVLPSVGTKKSDKIYLNRVVEWYKMTARPSASVQITEIRNFSAVCGEDLTISIRAKSFYLDTAYFNGLTKSYTIKTPCCDCGDDPCTEVDDLALIDQFVALINADNGFNGLGKYLIAERVVDGGGWKLRLTAIPITREGVRCDPTAFPFQYDLMFFWAWAYKGPELSQDYLVWDNCDQLATVVKVQSATYQIGTSAEATQLEKNYLSYNTAPIAKQLFMDTNFNNAYTTQVVDGTFYDFYYLKFKSPENTSWTSADSQDEAVILLNPTGQNAGTITVLTTFFGTPVDKSPNAITTTTTTSTSSTTSTTTTT